MVKNSPKIVPKNDKISHWENVINSPPPLKIRNRFGMCGCVDMGIKNSNSCNPYEKLILKVFVSLLADMIYILNANHHDTSCRSR